MLFRKKNKPDHRHPHIEYSDLWGLDNTLALVISDYLGEFIEGISLSGATPGSYVQKDGLESGSACWMADLKKMHWAFLTYYQSEHDDLSEEDRGRIKEGMQLFVDHFKDLWF